MLEARARREYIIDTFQTDFNNLIHLPAITENNSLVKALKLTTKTKVKDVILAVLFSHLQAIKTADLETHKNGTHHMLSYWKMTLSPLFARFGRKIK